MSNLQRLSNAELADLLTHYNLYATSNGGNKSAEVVPGPQMLEELKRRLLAAEPRKPVPASLPLHPNRLDVV